VHQLFEEQVRRAPAAVALIEGDIKMSYLELDERATRLAHLLQGQGAQPENRIAICMEPGTDLVVAVLAVLKTGAAYVLLDTALPADRLKRMIGDSGATTVLYSKDVAHLIRECEGAHVCMDAVRTLLRRYPAKDLAVGIQADNLAYVIFTSGSTGHPKAIGATHRSLVNRVIAQEQITPYEASEVYCQKTSVGFVDVMAEMWVPLLNGQPLVIAPREVANDPGALLELLERTGVSRLVSVPSLARAWAEDTQMLERLRGLRSWSLSGETLPPELLELLQRVLPNCSIVNIYGCSEVAADATYVDLTQYRAESGHLVPIGHPIANMRVYVLDDRLEPAAPEMAGELYVAGVGLARGYIGDVRATAERFIANPYGEPGSRLYRTGDRARYRSDGKLQYLGRKDSQVKIRGFRIELGEIEATLLRHPQLQEAAVVVGEAAAGPDRQLTAYVSRVPDSQIDSQGLREYLSTTLPHYMVPPSFVFMNQLPLTTSGKIDRKRLPKAVDTRDKKQNVGPMTLTEELVGGIWAEVLGLDSVAAGDNFFELGGHSLLAARVVTRIRASLGVPLSLRAMFEGSMTVRDVAARVDRARREEQRIVVPDLEARIPWTDRIPLSFAQERVWFVEQLQTLGAAHNEVIPIHLEGDLDTEALRRSLDELVRRHETLRTRILTTQDGYGVQQVDPHGRVNIREIDLCEAADVDREREKAYWIRTEVREPLELESGLFRVLLLRVGVREYVLLVTVHHIIADAWSLFGVLLHELRALYSAYTQGKESPLPELPVQYGDYVLWQRRWLNEEMMLEQLGYWKQQLDDIPPSLPLPTTRPRPTWPSFQGARHHFEVSGESVRKLKALARREGVTIYMVLLAALQVVLSRWCDQRDIVVGCPIAGRDHPKTEHLIGLFLNHVVMRTNLSGDPTFGQLLKRVEQVALGAYANQDIPFERLVAELEPQRDLSRQPLFQTVLVLQHQLLTRSDWPGLTLRTAAVEHIHAKFDLTITLLETPEGILGAADYATDLFDATTIEYLMDSYKAVLDGTVEGEQKPISQLPLLKPERREMLLTRWNRTDTPLPAGRCIHELFEEQVAKTPEAIALVCGEQWLTYRQANEQSSRLANMLRQRGVGPEVVVAICMDRSVGVILAALAVLKAGGAYLLLDPTYPAERLAFMLENSSCQMLLRDREVLHRCPPCKGTTLDWETELAHLTKYPATAPCSVIDDGNLAYIVYTSGSTGQPKAVCAIHRALVNRVQAQDRITACGADEVFCFKTAVGFVDAVAEMWVPLCKGGKLVIASQSATKDSSALARLIEVNGVTRLITVPSLARVWAEDPASMKSLEGLRSWSLSGEALDSELVQRLRRALPNCCLLNLYGCSEVAADATWVDVSNSDETATESLSIGLPLDNTRVYLLDGHLEPVPLGMVGDIYVGGVGLARGYLGAPAPTADRFIANPFGDPGSRMYRTGDMARCAPNGQLHFLGRRDTQIKIRGFRIEPGEIESVLATHPLVREAAVVSGLITSELPTDGFLVAYVTGKPGANLEGEDLRAYLAERLPEYMMPTVCTVVEELPLTPSGKLDRVALRNRDVDVREGIAIYEAPQGLVEAVLAEVWQEILNVPRVGRRDNFFAMGGHSLVAVRTIAKINQRLNIDLPLHVLFETPTVAEIASVVVSGIAEESADMLPSE
jgi:amino acid adenylation domain-containing protein